MSGPAQAQPLRQSTGLVAVRTGRRGMYEITDAIADWVNRQGITEGLLTLLIRHTSASLLIQENADPSVQSDLEVFLARIAPEGAGLYRHDTEGPDDMPAHIRAALTQTQLSIPLMNGRMALGTWQGIYVMEHRTHATQREIALHLIGA